MLDLRFSIGSHVHVELVPLGLGVHHASGGGQQERTQPQRVNLTEHNRSETSRINTERAADQGSSLTLSSWWKRVMAACRCFMGMSMSWTTWCCSYRCRMVSPWVSFSREILGGTIHPNSHRNTGLLPNGMISCSKNNK